MNIPNEILILLMSAAGLGVVHTALGPDHYLPFVAMSRAGNWSTRKTTWITTLCGVGHVLSSMVLGLLGVLLGVSVARLEAFEAARGNLAGWMLLGFGIALSVWGVHRAIRNKPHTHRHRHADGTVHEHVHTHTSEHTHAHRGEVNARSKMTPWILFTIFLFGPCEVLIPVIMYPAAKHSMLGVGLVGLVFGVATVLTMNVIVFCACRGVSWMKGSWLHRYGEALAGLVVLLSGAAVVFGL